MPVTINGNGTITGVSVGGLPDGIVDTDMIAANAVSSAKLASGAGGKILQVLQNTKKDTASTNSTSFTSTGLSQTITPSSTNSKILVMYSLFISVPAGTYSAGTSIIRDNTEIFIADALGSSDRVTTFMWPSGGRDPSLHSHIFLDSPNTTSSVSYSIEYKSFYSEATVYIGRSETASTSVYHGTTPSSLTLMEVAG